eukprot:135532-Alexandrium_andersonii.AAC.1
MGHGWLSAAVIIAGSPRSTKSLGGPPGPPPRPLPQRTSRPGVSRCPCGPVGRSCPGPTRRRGPPLGCAARLMGRCATGGAGPTAGG